MFHLRVNGETRIVHEGSTLSEALDQLGYRGKQFAVAVNGTFVPRHRHESYALEGNEALEVLAPMQGG